MRLPRFALVSVGSARFRSPRGNSKEGDSCYIPEARIEDQLSWPSLIIESGVSESLPQLRADASWWFANSNGDVKIAILIGVDADNQTIVVEKWELFPAERTRPSTRNKPAQEPKLIQTVHIRNFGTPQPLVSESLSLGFKKVFLRDAIPPNESSDIEISTRALQAWATLLRIFKK
jgi:hypothetical protein